MVRVKICGITRVEDALWAIDHGADAVGFVFYPRSPRHVTPEQARGIVAQLPPFVTTVGLFVDVPSAAEVRRVLDLCGLDVAQLHGNTVRPAELAPRRAFQVVPVRDAASLRRLDAAPGGTWLLDAWVPGEHGGTGQRFDWSLAAEVATRHRIILAGGLTPDNVARAVAQVRPWGVDVSSGVEAAPGIKDPSKVAAFIRRAKESETP